MAEGENSSSSGSGLTSALPFVGAALDFGSNIVGGLFNANQARKNRAFQERMYNKQVEDSISFWKMEQAYNHPQQVLERMKSAGLNPLLMYGDGASGMTASSQPNLPSAPSGAQGQMSGHTNFGQALAQSALLQAQIRNMNADSEQKETAAETNRQQAQNIEQDVLLKRLTKDINVAMRYRDYDFLNTSIDHLRNEIFNSAQITTQNVLTLMQGREYQIRHFHLDEYQVGQSILQGWENLKIGKLQANAALKQAAAQWKMAVNDAGLKASQIGEINQRIYQSRKMFPELYKQAKWTTFNNKLNTLMDFMLKGTDLSQRQIEIVKSKVGVIRQSLGNDSGLGAVFAPFQMPIGMGAKGIEQMYQEAVNGK